MKNSDIEIINNHRSVDGRRILVDIKYNDKIVKYWMKCRIGRICLCMWKYIKITQKKYVHVYSTVYSIKIWISVYMCIVSDDYWF